MGIFERKRVELQEQGANVVVASAQRIDLTDKGVARSYKKLQAQHAGWKSEAWRFYDELGEIWFGHNFVGNSLSRIRVFAADEADTDEPPAAIDDLTDPARVEVERLENGDGTAAMLHAIGIMMGVPGEGILLGYIDPEDSQEKWGFYSCDQVFINASQKWALRREPQDKTGIALDPETTVMVRLWRNHPRFRELSDSPMRPLLLLCDELQILSRTIRGAARSRLAGAGLLLWPSEAVPKPADETRQYAPGEIPFVQEWIEAAGTAIGDEASAMGVVPLFTTIPADYIEKVKHLDFNRPTDSIAADQRKEIIQRISFGLDIPGEVLTGMAKTSHWTAWAIDEQTFKAHLEPLIISVCGALTRGFLWPALRAHGLTEEQLKKKIIWYDASGLLGHPNRAQDAKDAHNSLVISDDALRQHLGFSETDAPSPEELERRIAVAKGSLDPASVLLILQHVLDTNVPSPAPAPAPTPLPAPGQPAIDATASEPTNQAKENAPPVKPTTDQPKGPSGIAASAAFEFNPDQPRDEHGRWGDGGGAGSAASGNTPAWAPSMSQAEAEAWSANSALPGAFYHGTAAENVSSIRENGFDPGRIGESTGNRGLAGEGTYMSSHDNYATVYGRGFRDNVLETRVNVQNPMSSKDAYALMERSTAAAGSDRAAWVRDQAVAMGHDAIYINQKIDGSKMQGADELVVFDPQNIVVVK